MKALHRILALGSLCTLLIAFGPDAARVSATGAATWPSLPAVPRNETFITGDSFTIPAFNANQWSPNNQVGDGIQQGVFESLFYLNYQTGRMEPWLATGFSANKSFTVYTISLRRGVTWSDGVPFTASGWSGSPAAARRRRRWRS